MRKPARKQVAWGALLASLLTYFLLTYFSLTYSPSYYLKNIVLRGGTNDAEGGSHRAAAGMTAAVPTFSGRSASSSEGIDLTPSASLMPASGGANDEEQLMHGRLKKLFVKTYEEKISWLHLFGTYHHVESLSP